MPATENLNVVDVNIIYIGDFTKLPADTRDSILHQTIILIERSFGQVYQKDLSEQDAINFLSSGDLYLLFNHEGKMIGIELLRLLLTENAKIMYGAGAVIDPEYQRRQIHSNFRRSMIEKYKPDYVSGRTQNPIVYGFYCKGKGAIYPAYNVPVPVSIRKIAREVSYQLGLSNFDPETLIQKYAYGESIYSKDKYPTIDPDTDIGRLFSQLEINKGDAFLILKKIEHDKEEKVI